MVLLGGGPTSVPDICKYCEKDFPWRSKKIELKENIRKVDKDDLFLLDNFVEKFYLVSQQIRQRYDDRPTLDIAEEYDLAEDLF